jgi:hypothetical protein
MSGAQIKIREKERAPGRYQRLDFFIKVLCPKFVGDEAHNKRVKDGLIIDQQTVYCVTSWAPVK